MRGNNVHDETHIMLLEGPPTPLAGPDRPEVRDSTCEQGGQKGSKHFANIKDQPGCEAAVPPTPLPAALPTPGPPVP